MFFQTTQLQTVTGIDTWNMPKLTEARALFAYSGITKVDLSNWNPTELRDFTHVFNGCSNLKEVKIENWEVPYLDGIFMLSTIVLPYRTLIYLHGKTQSY